MNESKMWSDINRYRFTAQYCCAAQVGDTVSDIIAGDELWAASRLPSPINNGLATLSAIHMRYSAAASASVSGSRTFISIALTDNSDSYPPQLLLRMTQPLLNANAEHLFYAHFSYNLFYTKVNTDKLSSWYSYFVQTTMYHVAIYFYFSIFRKILDLNNV